MTSGEDGYTPGPFKGCVTADNPYMGTQYYVDGRGVVLGLVGRGAIE